MRVSGTTTETFFETRMAAVVVVMVVAVVVLMGGYFQFGFARQQQRTFSSAEEATNALFKAVQTHNDQEVMNILGAGSELVSTGDGIQDQLENERFVQKYGQMHRLVREPDKTTVLYVGAENWPFPIPLVATKGVWRFDARAGSDEVLCRRIGDNEAMTIGAFRLLVLAQQEHLTESRNRGTVPEYATRFVGVKGAYNGLDWKEDGAVPQSLARAGISDGMAGDTSAVPYYGYYFRILTSQGKNAPGGSRSYISDGRLTGGFAFIAYPAEYRSSGVKTFIAGPDGIVYEKDLGKETARTASSMAQYNPDASWHVAEQ
ncbi:MAG TPA: DUF2950 family protein [Candidatus Angelobacter sp.]|nr:DUF2950 family protein [Candidatus Angelobacter sp.]